MTLRELWSNWIRFWFSQTSAVPVALFRIALGLLVIETQIFLVGRHVLYWYGYDNCVVPAEDVKRYYWQGAPFIDIPGLLPHTDFFVLLFWCAFIFAAVCLTAGLWTRWSAIAVALSLISLNSRMPFNMNGGDNMLRILSIYLCFANSGAAISFDRLIARWKHPTFGRQIPSICIFGQRLLQVELSLAYGATALMKLCGTDWMEGTAAYYALRIEEVYRISIPVITDNLTLNKLAAVLTLFAEAGMCTLVWIRELRYVILTCVFLLHLGIDTFINLPVFQWVFISALILFVYPQDLTALMNRIKRASKRIYGSPVDLFYSPADKRQQSTASVLEGLDVLANLNISGDPSCNKLTFKKDGLALHGFDLVYTLATSVPMFWPLGIILLPIRMILRRPTRHLADPTG